MTSSKRKGRKPNGEYWDHHYLIGGTSGEGSVGISRSWKWSIINEYVKDIDHVIDVGCGDLSFWEGRDCEDYTGIDYSETIIEKNKVKRPYWKFICAPSDRYIERLKNEHVFCFDLLFHLMKEDIFRKTLENLCKYSNNFIFINNWEKNPFDRVNSLKRTFTRFDIYLYKNLKYVLFPSSSDGVFQYYRPLNNYFQIFKFYNFKLIGSRKSPDNINEFYIFKKMQ